MGAGASKQGTADETAIEEDIKTRKGVGAVLRFADAFDFCAKSGKADGTRARAPY